MYIMTYGQIFRCEYTYICQNGEFPFALTRSVKVYSVPGTLPGIEMQDSSTYNRTLVLKLDLSLKCILLINQHCTSALPNHTVSLCKQVTLACPK